MGNEENTNHGGKWWGESITIWGAIVTFCATVLPLIGQATGLDITTDLARQAGEHLVQAAQGICGLIGVVMTIYGRARASAPLERRDVSLKL